MINFIKHFREWMAKQATDDRLTPHHVSLYLILFHYWNLNRFQNPLIIRRKKLMEDSKIGSSNTYARCLRELHLWSYIHYQPSFSAQYPSRVCMFTFDTSDRLGVDTAPPKNDIGTCTEADRTNLKSDTARPQNDTATGIDFNTIYKNNTNNINPVNAFGQAHHASHGTQKKEGIPPALDEIKFFFVTAQSSHLEAEKFYNYFQSNGWKVGGRAPMKDWQAAARNWILNIKKISDEKSQERPGKLSTVTNKDYAEPL